MTEQTANKPQFELLEGHGFYLDIFPSSTHKKVRQADLIPRGNLMRVETQWFIFSFIAQLLTSFIFPRKLEQGIITRLIKKLFKLPKYTFGTVRMAQVLVLWLFTHIVYAGPHRFLWYFVMSVLYLDDLFFDDNDKWKRRWESVKNKIKWKMELPQLVPSHGRTNS